MAKKRATKMQDLFSIMEIESNNDEVEKSHDAILADYGNDNAPIVEEKMQEKTDINT